jgi:hypothetical protein
MSRLTSRWLVLAALVSGAGGALLAQAPAPSIDSQSATSPPPAVQDSFVIVPNRAVTEIEEDMTRADADLVEAISAQSQATALRTEARTALDAKTVQIGDMKKRRDEAKKNKTSTATLDAELKALERERDLLSRAEALRATELDLAHESQALASMTKSALGVERELAVKRGDRGIVTAGTTAASSVERVILDLEHQTLTAKVKQADKQIDVASREKSLAENRLKLLDARRRIVTN